MDMSELYEKDEALSCSRKMKRFRLTHNQSRYLMSEFARQAHPDAAHRERLSREIPGLSPRQVQVWFQNRRAKLKRMSSDDRYHMMKSRALPEEFPILQTLYSYDLACASKTRATRSDSSCSSNVDERDCGPMSSQDQNQRTTRFSISSDSFDRDCQNEVSGSSCDVSPTSPCSTLPQDRFSRRNDPTFRSLQDTFSPPTAPPSGQQPFGSYFEHVSTYRSSEYMFPNCSVGECRSTKSVGDLWQARDEAQPLQMFPAWRPTLDTSFRNEMRHESISPQSCTSSSSENYLPANIEAQRFQNNHESSHVYSFNGAPRISSLPLASETILNMYDNGHGNTEKRAHKPEHSASQNAHIRA